MEEIKQVLQGEWDFDKAFKVFCQYSRNESLIRFISRKKCTITLKYQLEKLNSLNIKPNPHAHVYASYQLPTAIATPVVVGLKEEKPSIKRHDRLVRDDLPPDIQQLYDKNTVGYKELRSLHEKMKIVESDEARAEVRTKVVALAKEISKRWKLIDIELVSKSSSPTPDGWKESTARSYITRVLKKEEISDKDRIKARNHISELLKRELVISESTRNKLQERNLLPL